MALARAPTTLARTLPAPIAPLPILLAPYVQGERLVPYCETPASLLPVVGAMIVPVYVFSCRADMGIWLDAAGLYAREHENNG